jgi:hypothetical protein
MLHADVLVLDPNSKLYFDTFVSFDLVKLS